MYGCGRADGSPGALSFRAHPPRDPRERAPGAVPRHSRRAPYLAFLLDLLLLHGARGGALRAPQQLRRSTGPSVFAVRLLCDHGRFGGHAIVLGPLAGCGGVRRAAGFPLFVDRQQLDGLPRRDLHAVGVVLPAGHAGHAEAARRRMTMLQVQNASKNFGSLVAVQNVSLLVQPGELRAIIGPNRAGKTTFFYLIIGYLATGARTIMFDGHSVTRVPAHRRAGLSMARTCHVSEIFPNLTS